MYDTCIAKINTV